MIVNGMTIDRKVNSNSRNAMPSTNAKTIGMVAVS